MTFVFNGYLERKIGSGKLSGVSLRKIYLLMFYL